jgi:hypothetical protein
MPFVLETFRDRFPEFRSADGDMIEAAAAAAEHDITAAEYRDKAGEALLYLTAHKLALSPFAKDLRLVDDTGQTTYWREYHRITRLIRWPFMVT